MNSNSEHPPGFGHGFLRALTLGSFAIATISIARAQEPMATLDGPLADGSAQPAPDKPLPAVEVRESKTVALPERTVTINRIADPGLPVPKREDKESVQTPEEAAAWRDSPEVQEWLAEAREKAENTHHLIVSATVVDRQATFLHWFHEDEEYKAVSGLDWNFLTGFSSYKKGEERFVALLMVGNTTRKVSNEEAYPIPESLDVGTPNFVLTKGNAENSDALRAVEVLHELYQNEGNQLRQAYYDREQARAQREAEELANPPEPQDITLNYWKIQPKKEGRAQ